MQTLNLDQSIIAAINEIVAAHIAAIPRPYEGYVVQGSYKPSNGTVSVVTASSAALPNNGPSQPVVMKDVVLLTAAHLHQAGPIGGERCVVLPFRGGLAAHLLHEEDDSPGAPAGEHWIGHKSGSVIKLENSGDISTTAHAAHKVAAASSTHTVAGNETHTAANFSATATTSASMTAPVTHIGPLGGPYLDIGGSGAGGVNALGRAFEINEVVAAHNALVALFNAHTHQGVQGGGDTSGTTTSVATTAAPVTGATTATAG